MDESTRAQRSVAVASVMAERTTVHDYLPGEIDDAVVERALAAALAAPNHRMTEPWRFVVVGRQMRQALVEFSLEQKAKKVDGPLDPSTVQSVRDKMLNPARLIVVSQVRCDNPDTAREDYAAVACAVQNMMLSFHADGVGSKWSTGAVIRDARTYTHLGIDPIAQEIVGFIWVGLPAKTPIKVQRKLALGNVVRYLP